jgi:hypothetical protein
MFNEFCAKMLSGFEKISITSLRGYIYQLMEEYLGFLETDTPRIILYYRNKSHFEEIIRHAIAKYIIKSIQDEKKQSNVLTKNIHGKCQKFVNTTKAQITNCQR